ncbi:type II secretion system protein [Alkalihalophilus pseudofirmus]|uniref:Type II secretion system protein n=2 Tax=Alkalihalophilus pseudofirmus TaxID=79885 RepID=A0AAJ2U291_ALKPS|nr:type II secretion system protein [Alkalihalophilus pseudofirmus]MDV2885810.1 type II secretion system protein [Alkalihalophilus pseudofirmus]
MMKKWLKQTKNEKGLTLVELLAVVVILGIIAAIAVPSIGGIIENSKKDAAISNAQQVISAARLYAAGGGDTVGDDDGIVNASEISDYHETITDPWTKDEVETYTVTFEGTDLTPEISIEFTECNISEETAQTLSSKSRTEICGD